MVIVSGVYIFVCLHMCVLVSATQTSDVDVVHTK